MPIWYYFARPTNLAYHDLTTYIKPPPGLPKLLGLGHKFIPTPRYSHTWAQIEQTTYDRFDRNLRVKAFCIGHMKKPPPIPEELHQPGHEAELAQAQADQPKEDYNPRMYNPSTWEPPKHMVPKAIPHRLKAFKACLKAKFSRRRRAKSNLLPHQRRALSWLRQQKSLLVVQCDKNLGPAVIERTEYIKFAFKDHLDDADTYKRIYPDEVHNHAQLLTDKLTQWLKDYDKDLSKGERKFLRARKQSNTEPFAFFYLTMKVHKSPLATRPIVSCSGSLLEGLGLWIDDKLQQVARQMRSYFKSSFDLKQQLMQLQLPPNCYLFTADAKSMYTNIPTDFALRIIRNYLTLNKHRFPDLPIKAVVSGLTLIMKYSYFRFGDTIWKQEKGTAMGTPPAPPYATIYYGILEERLVVQPRFQPNLLFYRRFIDDVIGIWHVPDPITNPLANSQTWETFKAKMNHPQFKLTWEHTNLERTVDFMDLTISLTADNRITTTLFEKASNLHLYIPSHSTHPPGLISGIVYGNLFRIYTLCSDEEDRRAKTRLFFHRLLARGYQADAIKPLFHSAIQRARTYTGPQPKQNKDTMGFMLLHLQYHPKDPPSRELQQAWKDCISNPPYSQPLSKVKIPFTAAPGQAPTRGGHTEMGLDRMVIAYSRAPNLGNLLSYRKLPSDTGPPASSFAEE
jgi:hypothetical protein